MAKNSIALVLASLLCIGTASAADNLRKLVLTRNYKQAATLLQQQAAAGNSDAQYQLGVLYRNGTGVAKDQAKAREWLQRAADAGNANAKIILVRTNVVPPTRGIAPPAQGPLLPLKDASHLIPNSGGAPTWLQQVTARSLAKPIGLRDSVNAQDGTGETALLIASRLNRSEAVSSLLAQNADPNLADKRGITAIMWAARNGNGELIELLNGAGAKVDARAATWAAEFCKPDAISALFRIGVKAEAAKINAIMAERCPDVPQLRTAQSEDKPEPDKPDADGFTALHHAAARGDMTLVSKLLANGATPEALTPNADTPLMLAALSGNLAAVQLLLPKTSDINLKNVDGETALYLAVKAGSIAVAKALIEAGASTDSRTITRDTPRKIAERVGSQEMKLLIEG